MASPRKPGLKKIALFSQEGSELMSDSLLETRLDPVGVGAGGHTHSPAADQELEQEQEGGWREQSPLQHTQDPVCLSCLVKFGSREDQVEHYKLDWHRYNLKRKLKGLESVDQNQFERIAGVD